MNIKDELKKLKDIIIKECESNNTKVSRRSIDLNKKIDNFINWYFNTIIKGSCSYIGEYYLTQDMRNFIEKMAVWYELRYPDYDINKLMYCCGADYDDIDDVMFKNNIYINDLLDANNDARQLEWHDFYNAQAFISSLPVKEKHRFDKPAYKEIVWFDTNFDYYCTRKEFGYKSINSSEYILKNAHLHLTPEGIVEMAENVSVWTNFVIQDEELEGMHVIDVVKLFQEKGIKLPEGNELEKVIRNVTIATYQQEEMLNCVMYRIIERGKGRIGPRRAFLFALEFKRNIDIPMMYAIDRTDPGLRLFINNYLKAGGNKDLECYLDYFSNIDDNAMIKTISIQELILTQRNNSASFYTKEETELHQKLVNTLNAARKLKR